MMEQAQKKPHRKLYSSLALVFCWPSHCAQQRRARRHNPHLPKKWLQPSLQQTTRPRI